MVFGTVGKRFNCFATRLYNVALLLLNLEQQRGAFVNMMLENVAILKVQCASRKLQKYSPYDAFSTTSYGLV